MELHIFHIHWFTFTPWKVYKCNLQKCLDELDSKIKECTQRFVTSLSYDHWVKKLNMLSTKNFHKAQKSVSILKPSNHTIQNIFLLEIPYIYNTNMIFLYMKCSTYKKNLLPVFWKSILSFKPSLNSGIPERNTLILTLPTISERRTFPLALTRRFTDSMTSKNTLM